MTQIGHEVILLGRELVRNISGQGKALEFLPWRKKTYSTHTGCGNRTHDDPVRGGVTPRLVHRLNLSATEDWLGGRDISFRGRSFKVIHNSV